MKRPPAIGKIKDGYTWYKDRIWRPLAAVQAELDKQKHQRQEKRMEAVRDLKPAGLAEQLMIEKAEAAIRKYAQIMAEHVANTLGEASIDIKIKIGTKDDKKSGQLEFYTKPADVTVSLKESAEKMGARISSDSGHVQLSLFEL